MKRVHVLENLCPFCGKTTGYATITLTEEGEMKGKTKAIGDPCLRCGRFLDEGDVGFLALNGAGIILRKKEGLQIMKKFEIAHLYRDDRRTVVKVKEPFWEIQKARVKKIIKKSRGHSKVPSSNK